VYHGEPVEHTIGILGEIKEKVAKKGGWKERDEDEERLD